MKEIWKDIEGYNGKYQVSNFGRVKSLYTNKYRKHGYDKDKYHKIELYINGKYQSVKIHRLVAQYFIDNPNKYPEVNHIDGDKNNNRVDNLEWCSSSYNSRHRIYTLHKNYLKPCRKIKCVETGMMFDSISEASRYINVCISSLRETIDNPKRKCKGYHWASI